jgi:hypothetical protein
LLFDRQAPMRQREELCFEQALEQPLAFGCLLSIGAQLLDERPLRRDLLVDLGEMMLRVLQMIVIERHAHLT